MIRRWLEVEYLTAFTVARPGYHEVERIAMSNARSMGLSLNAHHGGFAKQTSALANDKEVHRSAIGTAVTRDETKPVNIGGNMEYA
jgi:pyridoxine 5'-phosphate synthase PdxJ